VRVVKGSRETYSGMVCNRKNSDGWKRSGGGVFQRALKKWDVYIVRAGS